MGISGDIRSDRTIFRNHGIQKQKGVMSACRTERSRSTWNAMMIAALVMAVLSHLWTLNEGGQAQVSTGKGFLIVPGKTPSQRNTFYFMDQKRPHNHTLLTMIWNAYAATGFTDWTGQEEKED